MSQPVVSKAIADMEHALGVRLLERSRRGVELTGYGQAVTQRGAAVFDELRECVREIEFLADPTVGTVAVGGDSPRVAGLLPAAIGRLRRRYPRIDVHVVEVASIPQQYRALRELTVDLIVGRIAQPLEDEFAVDVLFEERTYVVAGPRSRWARRCKIELAELAEGPGACRRRGLPPARRFLSAPRGGDRVGAPARRAHGGRAVLGHHPGFDASVRAQGSLRKGAAVDLPTPPSPAGIMTLKSRTLGPVARLFVDSVRDVVKPLARHHRT